MLEIETIRQYYLKLYKDNNKIELCNVLWNEKWKHFEVVLEEDMQWEINLKLIYPNEEQLKSYQEQIAKNPKWNKYAYCHTKFIEIGGFVMLESGC